MATVQIERSPLEGTRLKHSLLWTGTSSDPTTTAVANDTFWVSNAAIAPTGISSGENFGTPTIGGQDTISPAGFTDEGVGVPAIRGTDNISPSSITPPGYPGPDSFGNPTILLQNQILVNTSIFSLEHFGTPSVVGENIIQPSGILPLQVTPPDFRQFGVASIQGDNNIFPSGFIDEGVGIPWLRQGGAVFLDTFGIPSDEQFGIPTLTTPGVLPGNSGFLYTYYANVNERTDGTAVLKLDSGDLMIGRAGYFTQDEYDYYSQLHVLIPGVVKWWRELAHAADFGWQQANSVLPGAPTNLRSVTGANSVFLTWKIPVWNGGSRILGYRIYPYANGIPQPYIDTHSEDPEYTLYGLTTGVTYTFLVAAVNVVGVGRRSFWSNISIPTSIAPQNVQPSGIATRESFGAASIALSGGGGPVAQSLHPAGVSSAEHFGSVVVTGGGGGGGPIPQVVNPTGIPSAEHFGATTVAFPVARTLHPVEISSAEHFGNLTVARGSGGSPGTIYFDWNAWLRSGQLSPFTGEQFANTGTTSVNNRWRGNLYWIAVGGHSCADFQNTPPPPLSPGPLTDPTGGAWNFCAGTFTYTGAASTITSYPFDRAHVIAFYVPAGGLNSPSQVTMFEPFFNNVGGQGPFKFLLNPTAGKIVCDFLGGLWTSTGGYTYNGSNGTAPQKTVAYSLTRGAWNYIGWTTHYATDLTGGGQFYYKDEAATSWSLGDAFGANLGPSFGFPTATWANTSGPPAPPLHTSFLLNNYELCRNPQNTGPIILTSDFDMYYGRVMIADAWSTVLGQIP